MEETNEARSLFIQKGRFDAKTFASSLPVTAQKLRDGTTDARTVASRLVFNELLYLPKNDNPDEKEDIFQYLVETISREVFEHSTEVAAFSNDLVDSYKSISSFPMEEMVDKGIFVTLVQRLQQAFDATLERWERSSWGLRTGICRLNNMTKDGFFHVVAEKLSQKYDTSQVLDAAYDNSLARKLCYIAEAANNVEEGLDQIETTCWTCGSCHDGVKRCSKCRVARYCSPECQKRSWYGGHKKECKVMRETYDRFIRDLELMDRTASEENGMDVMPKANPFHDYAELRKICFRWKQDTILVNLYNYLGCAQPSIATFHQNLRTIAQGGSLFIFGANQAQDEEVCTNPISPSEHGPFREARGLLCLDNSSLVNREQGDLSVLFRAQLAIGESGTTLSAKRFLHIYETTDEFFEPLDGERNSEGIKSDRHAYAIKILKEKYNKNE